MTAVLPSTKALADATASESALRRFLHGLPGVDEVGGADTPGKVRAMSAKAVRPDPTDPSVPSVAAVCVYPDLVAVAREAVAGSAVPGGVGGSGHPRVKIASVATAFPSGRASLRAKLADVGEAVDAGADEIDMVIDRGAFLAGRYGQVLDEIQQVRAACGDAHLKVILETGELATLDNVRRASWLALAAGADFIKTSTGKVSPAATLPAVLVMLEAVRDVADLTGHAAGVKAAGGIRNTKDAIRYLVLVHEVAGAAWLTPDRFRFGASTLLNDLLMQREKQRTGAYAGRDYYTID